MNTKELRIGNLVYNRIYKQPMKVTAIGIDYIYLDFKGNVGDYFEDNTDKNGDLEDTDGIKLDKETLFKFGFKKKYDFYDKGKFYIDSTDFMCGHESPNDVYNMITKIEYVHQLQNLYFALTGEELTLKENE